MKHPSPGVDAAKPRSYASRWHTACQCRHERVQIVSNLGLASFAPYTDSEVQVQLV